ncbi:hypothetical protein OUZ56_004172 [Daphnia magna]|uniref:Uncharacterized protein n=1 Tax=Daphnia magna TaxID=35525 RepID=A0ABQ9YP38_9CRUS|nr:hypothetical protein OUZ56_004172 [Daphnia magna]
MALTNEMLIHSPNASITIVFFHFLFNLVVYRWTLDDRSDFRHLSTIENDDKQQMMDTAE